MIQFIISFILVLVMLLEKLYFFNLEKLYAKSFLGLFEIIVFFIIFIIGVLSFIYRKKDAVSRLQKNNDKKFTHLAYMFLAGSILIVLLSFFLNFSKSTVNWDAIALYDARAKFLESGMKFSEMTSLAKYDNLNKYYYLLYPPYTSIAHYFWERTPILMNIPVGVYYSFGFSILITFIFLLSSEYFGFIIGGVLSFLVASNSSIFNISTIEYTNLPYSLYLTIGIFLIFSYLKNKNLWRFVLGALLISSSIWIRFLEPMWLVVVISLATSFIIKKQSLKKLVLPIILGLLCLTEYTSWNYFVSYIGKSPSIVTFSEITILQPLVGIFTGAGFSILLFFIKAWGISLLVSILALASAFLNWKKVSERLELLFLAFIILFSIVLYFLQLYFVSFQADWWQASAQSLDRSSTFLIPISLFILVYSIVNSKLFLFKQKRKIKQ